MSDKISLIIPAKNEMESLEEVLSEIEDNPYVDEKILIVDSIKDNSIPIAKKFDCKIIIQKKIGQNLAKTLILVVSFPASSTPHRPGICWSAGCP